MLSNVKINFKNFLAKKNDEQKVNEIYFKSLKKVRRSDEYEKNKLKIDSIRKTLIKNADIPEKLIDLLIEATQENVALEYESIIKQ